MIGVNVAVRPAPRASASPFPIDQVMDVAAQLLSVEQLREQAARPRDPSRRTKSAHRWWSTKSKPGSPAADRRLPSRRRDRRSRRRHRHPAARPRTGPARSPGRRSSAGRSRSTVDNAPTDRLDDSSSIASHELLRQGQTWDVLGLELTEEPKTTFQKREHALSRRHASRRRAARQPRRQGRHPPGDILVGMHGWETASTQDIDYIVTRPNLAQMGPTEVLRPPRQDHALRPSDVNVDRRPRRDTTGLHRRARVLAYCRPTTRLRLPAPATCDPAPCYSGGMEAEFHPLARASMCRASASAARARR